MGFTISQANTELTRIFTGVKYVAMHSAEPGKTGANELSGNGYARQACTFVVFGDIAKNAEPISLTAVGGDLVMTHFSACSELSGDNYQMEGKLYGESFTIPDGETKTIPVYGLTFRLGGEPAAVEEATTGNTDDILSHDTPIARLTDIMGLTLPPSFMWGGNEASGATEIGGSGADLISSGVTHEQANTPLDSVLTILHDANADYVGNSDGTDLQMGTQSFALVFVGDITDLAAIYNIFGDRGADGYQVRTTASAGIDFVLDSSGGTHIPLVAGPHTAGAMVLTAIRNTTTSEATLITPEGSDIVSSIATDSINNPTPKFVVGDTATGSGFRGSWGILALFEGAAAEAITVTHHENLETFLGL